MDVSSDKRLLFAEDGFVPFPKFFANDNFDDLLRNVERFIAELVPGLPPEHVFYEDKGDTSSVKQIQQMHTYDSWFENLFLCGRLVEVAQSLLDGPVVGKNLQYFNKPPGIGKPTPAHQDGYYFMLDPCEAVTMWLALDDVDEDNGCVRYVRGSHRQGMRTHGRTDTLGFSQGIVDYPIESDLNDEVAMPAGRGDLLVHDAMTIHRADGNHSATRSRRALGFIFFSERAREDIAAKEAYQRKLAEELRAEGKI